jgi:fluoroquinolone resistance protein
MKEQVIIENVDYNQKALEEIYVRCIFRFCDFTKLTVSHITFEDCEFHQCNFSLTNFSSSSLCNIVFAECSMVGADFSDMGYLSHGLTFQQSQLDYANFSTCKIHQSNFNNCKLLEVCFDDADIRSSVFQSCDLNRASFHQTDLEKVDFSTSFNLSINPNECHLKQTIFSEGNLRGLLEHLDIIIS